MDRLAVLILLVVTVTSGFGELKPCQYNQCMNGGSCYDRSSGSTIGDFNFYGMSSSIVIFGNSGGGSFNGFGNTGNNVGDQTNTQGDFTCECPAGFEGSTCEIEKTTCEDNLQCLNGGTCRFFSDGSGNSYCTCPDSSTGNRCQHLIEAVQGRVRLVNGDREWNGRLEIYDTDRWKTVCRNGWGRNNAAVVCRELGFDGVDNSFRTSFQGNGDVPLNEDADCGGCESSFADCPRGNDTATSNSNLIVGLDCRPFN